MEIKVTKLKHNNKWPTRKNKKGNTSRNDNGVSYKVKKKNRTMIELDREEEQEDDEEETKNKANTNEIIKNNKKGVPSCSNAERNTNN